MFCSHILLLIITHCIDEIPILSTHPTCGATVTITYYINY